MAEASPLDDRGRITIQREFRRFLAGRVVQILTPHGVLLRPVPDSLPADRRLPSAVQASGEDAARDEADR